MEKPIVSCTNFCKSYEMSHGLVQALKPISLTIEQGEWIAIMGASGSGKSTLLHLLGCLDRPTHGQYFLNGEDVSKLNDAALALIRASKIGFIFQSFNLISQYSVFENVQVPFQYQPQPLPADEIEHRIVESVSRVGLKHRLYHLPSQLSGGEVQRVAIARALAIQPLLILADEPTGNLDTENGKNILSLFHDLNQQGVTLAIVTHDEEVGKYGKRIVRMRDGQIISDHFNEKKII